MEAPRLAWRAPVSRANARAHDPSGFRRRPRLAPGSLRDFSFVRLEPQAPVRRLTKTDARIRQGLGPKAHPPSSVRRHGPVKCGLVATTAHRFPTFSQITLSG